MKIMEGRTKENYMCTKLVEILLDGKIVTIHLIE